MFNEWYHTNHELNTMRTHTSSNCNSGFEHNMEKYIEIQRQQGFMHDIMLAHKIIESGVPNKFQCRIPVATKWNLQLMHIMLHEYYDQDVLDWLKFGFSISREDTFGDLEPAEHNHMGAIMFPQAINDYIETEIKLGATMGPFKIPPFLNRIGISPLSTRPKRDSDKKRIILDLSYPFGKICKRWNK